MKDISVLVSKPNTSFIEVKCSACGNAQVTFSSPTNKVKCLACDKEIVVPKASKGELSAEFVKTVDRASHGRVFKPSLKESKKKAQKPVVEVKEKEVTFVPEAAAETDKE